MQASLSGFLSFASKVTPLATKIFQNKTQEGLASGDSRLPVVMCRRWKVDKTNCHRFNVCVLWGEGHWGE